MRPSIQEQLDQSARLLETFVTPAVADRMPHIILEGVIENLKLLSRALPQIQSFLTWDNDAMIALLADLAPGLDSDAATSVAPRTDSGGLDRAEEDNDALRHQLTSIICSMAADDARLSAIRSHLIARASRFPLRSIPSTPGGSVGNAS